MKNVAILGLGAMGFRMKGWREKNERHFLLIIKLHF